MLNKKLIKFTKKLTKKYEKSKTLKHLYRIGIVNGWLYTHSHAILLRLCECIIFIHMCMIQCVKMDKTRAVLCEHDELFSLFLRWVWQLVIQRSVAEGSSKLDW